MEMSPADYHRMWYKKVLFSVQLIVLIAMLITAITNIVLKTGNLPLWTAVLGSSLGYLLPNPKLGSFKSETATQTHSNPSSVVT